jgi:hypothetical protein
MAHWPGGSSMSVQVRFSSIACNSSSIARCHCASCTACHTNAGYSALTVNTQLPSLFASSRLTQPVCTAVLIRSHISRNHRGASSQSASRFSASSSSKRGFIQCTTIRGEFCPSISTTGQKKLGFSSSLCSTLLLEPDPYLSYSGSMASISGTYTPLYSTENEL